VYFHTPALATRRRTTRLLHCPACNLLAMFQTNLADIALCYHSPSLCYHSPSLWHCHRAENKTVSPIVPISVSASLHSALKRLGLLTTLAQLLGLDSCLHPTILIILVSLDILTTCTRTSLIVGPTLWIQTVSRIDPQNDVLKSEL
jgi:hypothetical protein